MAFIFNQSSMSQMKTPSVLIVDDEPMARTLLRLVLVRAGYEVTEAEDGEEAFSKLKKQHPHLVILDAMMPGVDGFAICKTIAQDNALSHIPVIMLSAKTDLESRKRGMAAGAARYLTKPISPDHLTRHVQDILALENVKADGVAATGD